LDLQRLALLLLLLLLLLLALLREYALPCVMSAPHPHPEALQLQHLAVVHKQVDVCTIRLHIPAGGRQGTGGQGGRHCSDCIPKHLERLETLVLVSNCNPEHRPVELAAPGRRSV
jgi:hypothetical protein